MKKSIVVLFTFIFSVSVFSQQTVNEQFQKINTVQQAEQFVAANPQLKPAILKLSVGKDSSLIDKRLLRQKQGDIFSVGYVTYKVIEAKESIQYRASYIFLDGGALTKPEIDSLKKVIMDKIAAGADWKALSNQ